MDALIFGELLKQARARTKDPDTGRAFSRDKLADALQDLSGIAGMRHKVRNWEDGQSVPEDKEIMDILTNLVAEHQGFKDQAEIEGFYREANFEPPSTELLRQFLAHLDQPFRGVTSKAGEISSEEYKKNIDQESAGQPSFSKTGPPDIKDQVEMVRENFQIQVIHTDKGWLLPVEMLVVVPFGEFYKNFEDSLPSASFRKKLRATLEKRLQEGFDYTQPIIVKLDADQAKIALPNAPVDRAYIGMAIARDDQNVLRLENIRPMIKVLIENCSRYGIHSLALPLIGTGGDKGGQLDVLRAMLAELTDLSPYPDLKRVAIITLLPEVVEVARTFFSSISDNEFSKRAQPLANDQPEGEDQLGIQDEVYALADTLLLKEVEPPLSVAILGGWGSGKSFIMHLIQDRMTLRRIWPNSRGWDDPTSKTRGSDYVGHIYQIKFNAWNYAKSNLWASLMQTIFFELNRQLSLEKLISKALSIDEGPYYQLLYKENIHPDNNLLTILAEWNPDQKKEVEQIQVNEVLNSQILWNRLREHKKELYQDLTKTEKELAEAKNQLDLALRIHQEQASVALSKQERVAGFFAVKDLIQKTANDALSGYLRQVLSYQDLTEDTIGAIAAITANTEFTPQEKEAELRRLGIDRIHAFDLSRGDALDKSGVRQKLELNDEQIKEVVNSLKSVKTTLVRIIKIAAKNWYWSLLCIFLFFGTWIYLPGLLEKLFTGFTQSYPSLVELFRLIGALIPTGIPIARQIMNWNNQVKTILDEYEAALDRGKENWQDRQNRWIDQQKAQETEKVSAILEEKKFNYEEKLTRLQDAAASGSLTAQEALVNILQSRAEEKRRKVGPTAKFVSLIDFVRARLDAKDYEGQLGLMHQVKLDIDELTNSLSIQEWDDEVLVKEKRDFFPRGPARIVLFIDDLDRCPPPRVVEVLEAVQLLLRTNLFVVILGLDTRYITLALEKEYKEILRHEGDPSGLDYIEKIIQIPYGVRPIEEDKIKSFLKSQMKVKAEKENELGKNSGSSEGNGKSILTTLEPGKPKIIEEITRVDQKESDNNDQALLPTSGIDVVQTPRRAVQALQEIPPQPSDGEQSEIDFTIEDLDDVDQCGKLVKLTPRSLKRLVNVLKLVKLYWNRSPSKEPTRDVKKTVIGMLAISAAYPEIMREAFVRLDISYKNEKEKKKTLIKFLKDLKWQESIEESFAGQLSRFRADVVRLQTNGYCSVTLDKLEQNNFNVIRSFSFVGEPSYWNDRTKSPETTGVHTAKKAETAPQDGKNDQLSTT